MNFEEKSDGNAEFGQQYLRLLGPSQMSLIII